MEKHELAFEDYKNGMKQKEIAKKYGTTINTVKSWSRRYEWSKKKKKGAPQNKSVHTKKECKKIAEEIVETSELDEEHQLFCIYYLKYHNKVKAYQKVKPNTPYNSACVMASRWSKQPAVIEEINRLKKELYEDALLDPHDIVQKYIDIAFADLNDYLEYGQEEVPVIIKNPDTGEDEVLKRTVNMVKFKESAFADGTILSEVKQVRFLIGSTQKMGAGTNVQDRLIALHHLDVPWRPSDIEQQEGRILRQGNRNDIVHIYRYVTEGTFDSYSWQVIENKQKFISQIMTSKSPVRSCEDVDEAALTYAEVKALATGNPYIKEKMDLDIQVSRLKLMKANHTSQIYRLEDNIAKNYPKQIEILKERIRGFQADMETVQRNLPAEKENFSMKVGNRIFTDKKEAGSAILAMCKGMDSLQQAVEIGVYAGMTMKISFDSFNQKFVMSLKGALSHSFELGPDAFGNITRLHHILDGMAGELSEAETKLNNVTRQLETAKLEVQKSFPEEELKEKMERLAQLDALLNMDEKAETPVVENEPTVTPLGDWLTEHLLPEFMEEYEISEERARELLADVLPEEENEIVCFSSEQNAESLDSEEMQKQMAEYMDGDYYAIPLSDTEYLIAPKVEQDAVIYLRTVLSRLSDSVLSSPAMKTHAAYEYDAGENRMKPFDHLRILRGLSAVGEERPVYHVRPREPADTRRSHGMH